MHGLILDELIEQEHDDEMFIDEIHILFEKIDQNYLFQMNHEQLFQIIKLQIITELK